MSWLSNAWKSAGRTVKSGVRSVSKATGEVTGAITKIPVVGPGIGSVYKLSSSGVAAPWKVASNIAKGQRVDKAFSRVAKENIRNAKAVAPYAQSVISFVPGIGQTASAAIGTGLALANGRPITEAVISAVKGAIPGGPMAQSTFSLGVNITAGEKLDKALLNSLPISDSDKNKLVLGLKAVNASVKGKTANLSQYDNAIKILPPELQTALQAGVATGEGRKLQESVVKGVTPKTLNELVAKGKEVISSEPILKAGCDSLKNNQAKNGFELGTGMMAFKLKSIDVIAIRHKLTPQQKGGFDLAVSANIGMRTVKPPSSMQSPAELFGYYTTHGVRGNTPKRKGALVGTVIKNPVQKTGVEIAIKEIQEEKEPWWKKLLHKIGIDVNEHQEHS